MFRMEEGLVLFCFAHVKLFKASMFSNIFIDHQQGQLIKVSRLADIFFTVLGVIVMSGIICLLL